VIALFTMVIWLTRRRAAGSESQGLGPELLIYMCSPSIGRLPAAKDEVEKLQLAVRHSYVLEAGTADTLQRTLLNTPPRWFHFIGHADGLVDGNFTLGFTTAEGELAMVSPDHIAAMLADCRRLELVVINGCHSYALGQALRQRGMRAVVCWRTATEDKAASIFSVGLFAHFTRTEQDETLEARCTRLRRRQAHR
jgi:hypothetical protein